MFISSSLNSWRGIQNLTRVAALKKTELYLTWQLLCVRCSHRLMPIMFNYYFPFHCMFVSLFAELEALPKPECTIDSECSDDRSCINQRCQNPCVVANPCGTNADCRTFNHRPSCQCPAGWGGNPQIQCYKRKCSLKECRLATANATALSPTVSSAAECKSDNDCLLDKACINNNCLNPCTHSSTRCGRGAECRVQLHLPQCYCPPGTQGDPFASCIAGVCQYNEDCADHEACDRLNRVCRPVCSEDTCAETAVCIGKKHQPKCTCPPGTSGNPYIECHGWYKSKTSG